MKKLAQVFDYRMWFHDFVKITGCLPVLIDLRIKNVFLNKKTKGWYKGKYLISSNHSTYSDPIIILNAMWRRRVGFVATKNFFKGKFLKAMFRGFGCIPVDKQNPTLQTFNDVKDMLNRGHLVCVFPEGEVTKDEEVHAFKAGIVMMAVMSEADILPVYIVKRENRFKRQIVMIGEKINYKEYVKGVIPTMDEIKFISELLLTKEKELKDNYIKRFKEKDNNDL